MPGFVFRTPYKHIHSALRWTLLECIHKQKNRHAQNRVEFKTGFLVLCRAKFLECSLRKRGVLCFRTRYSLNREPPWAQCKHVPHGAMKKELFLWFADRITGLPLSRKRVI